MLLTLWRAGYVTLEPEPPPKDEIADVPAAVRGSPDAAVPPTEGLHSGPSTRANDHDRHDRRPHNARRRVRRLSPGHRPRRRPTDRRPYQPILAYPTPELSRLVLFRGVNPLYGMFLVNQLGIADRAGADPGHGERAGAAALGGPFRPRAAARPAAPRAAGHQRLDEQLLQLGPGHGGRAGARCPSPRRTTTAAARSTRSRSWVLTLAEKLRRLFDYDFPGVHDLRTQPVWAAGELLEFGGDFNKYVTSKSLQKQEGIIFRHLLRLILLVGRIHAVLPARRRRRPVARRPGGHRRPAHRPAAAGRSRRAPKRPSNKPRPPRRRGLKRCNSSPLVYNRQIDGGTDMSTTAEEVFTETVASFAPYRATPTGITDPERSFTLQLGGCGGQ